MENGKVSGIVAVFTILLILKLIGFIDWSWWYVTLPLWGSVAIGLLFALIKAFNKANNPKNEIRKMIKEKQVKLNRKQNEKD